VATSIEADLAGVSRLGPPPSFTVRTDRQYCEVDVATEPGSFAAAVASRRRPVNFNSSREAGPILVRDGVARHTLDGEAWKRLRQQRRLHYRAVCYDGSPSAPLHVESTSDRVPPARIPSVSITLPASPPVARSVSGSLSWLRVDGNRVVNLAGDVVVLRGITRSGMEYTVPNTRDPTGVVRRRSREAAGITKAEIQELVGHWRANVVRVPIDQDAVARDDYRRDLDEIVQWAAEAGAYTLLAVAQTTPEDEFGCSLPGRVEPFNALPNEKTVTAWRLLAGRYAEEPAVLYELLDAPAAPFAGDADAEVDPAPPGKPTLEDWHEWLRRLRTAVHTENARALLFARGWDRGLDLESFPVSLPAGGSLPNTVYSARVTPSRAPEEEDFERFFGSPRLRREHPVFVEWGGGRDDLAWGVALERYLRARHRFVRGEWQGLAGWSAASWADEPLVVERGVGGVAPNTWRTFVMDGEHNRPTEFGDLVRHALATTWPALTTDFDPARPRAARARDAITTDATALLDDLFVVRGDRFARGSVIVFTAGEQTKEITPAAVLPHLLVVPALPTTPDMPRGPVQCRVRRAGGALTEPVSVTIQTGAVPQGAKVLVPGAQHANPYTIAFVANPAVLTGGGSFRTDGITGQRALFNGAVAAALRALFGSAETLLHPYAGEVRVVLTFVADPNPRDEVALCVELETSPMGPPTPTMGPRSAAIGAFLDRAGIAPVDVCFVVYESATRASSSLETDDDPGSAGRGVPFDLVGFVHRRRSIRPGAVALNAARALAEPIMPLHEFFHAAGSSTDGACADLYRDEGDPPRTLTIVNRKRRPRGDAIPRWFARYDGVPYASDPKRDGLSYPRLWTSFGPELADPTRPNILDAYERADDQTRCRGDLVALSFLRDRIEWKLGR
jgi:hypothetical protein